MDNEQNETTTTEKRMPVQKFSIGSVKVAIWANHTKNGVMHSVTASRSYRVGENLWKNSTSFSRDDLLSLAKLLDQAHSWIAAQPHSIEKAA